MIDEEEAAGFHLNKLEWFKIRNDKRSVPLPLSGWSCVEQYSLPVGDSIMCQACDERRVRHVSKIVHPDVPGWLLVGKGCGSCLGGNWGEWTKQAERSALVRYRTVVAFDGLPVLHRLLTLEQINETLLADAEAKIPGITRYKSVKDQIRNEAKALRTQWQREDQARIAATNRALLLPSARGHEIGVGGGGGHTDPNDWKRRSLTEATTLSSIDAAAEALRQAEAVRAAAAREEEARRGRAERMMKAAEARALREAAAEDEARSLERSRMEALKHAGERRYAMLVEDFAHHLRVAPLTHHGAVSRFGDVLRAVTVPQTGEARVIIDTVHGVRVMASASLSGVTLPFDLTAFVAGVVSEVERLETVPDAVSTEPRALGERLVKGRGM